MKLRSNLISEGPLFKNFLGVASRPPKLPKVCLSLPSMSFYSVSYAAKLWLASLKILTNVPSL